jgi:hypothetical protein
MEGYIYLGEYFDVLFRTLGISDKKIGKSIDPVTREVQLSRTKSPIKYRILVVYKVDDMGRVEKMLNCILDSRRVEGEWFKDDEDTLTSEFINFMEAYGAERVDMDQLRPTETEIDPDTRLLAVYNKLAKTGSPSSITLIRTYKGVDYEVILDNKGYLNFNGEKFDTPNKLYNNGIVKFATGKKGNSGTNQMSQFVVKETGERLREP